MNNFFPIRKQIETTKVLKQLNKSSRALAELKVYFELIPNKDILINSLVLQEAKISLEIENVVTTYDNLYKSIVIPKNIGGDIKQIINYRKTLLKGVSLIQSSSCIEAKTILQIQEMLEDGKSGIRKIKGKILRSKSNGDIVYVPSKEIFFIQDLLKNIENYYNKQTEIDSLIKLAVSYAQFEGFCIFHKGNGTSGRILNVLYLLKENLLSSPILCLSSYIIKNKENYYDFLNKITKENKWEEWIIYILKGIEFSSKKTLEVAKKIKNLMDKTTIEVKKKLPKIYSEELIEFIFAEVYTKGSNLVKKGFANRKTVSKYLKSMEEINILKREKIGREIVYININLFNLLKST